MKLKLLGGVQNMSNSHFPFSCGRYYKINSPGDLSKLTMDPLFICRSGLTYDTIKPAIISGQHAVAKQ